jgi:hypothetical protein
MDELEQQVPDIFAGVPIDFVRKSIQSVSSRQQKCLQSDGACDKT